MLNLGTRTTDYFEFTQSPRLNLRVWLRHALLMPVVFTPVFLLFRVVQMDQVFNVEAPDPKDMIALDAICLGIIAIVATVTFIGPMVPRLRWRILISKQGLVHSSPLGITNIGLDENIKVYVYRPPNGL